MIPYSTQTLDADDIKAVEKILKSPVITRGPVVREFEEAVAKYVGAKYAVAFTSGTSALQGAYFAAGLEKGDEIITTPLTFAATANAALWQGAKVVFADIDETGNIDPKEVAKKITKKTKVICAVDYAGLPADLDALKALAKKHKLVLIEDGVHALGARYQGHKVGAIADMTMFSFHPVKPITAGEGGVVTTNDARYYARLLRFRNHGMTRDRALFKTKDAPPWHYEMHELGINSWMTDFQAALAISQLKKLDRFVAARRAIAKRYIKELKGLEHVALPKEAAGRESGWHLFAARFTSNKKDAQRYAYDELQKAGIGVQVHYMPIYFHPYYQKLGYKKGLCPRAEAFAASEISLPIFPRLTPAEQNKVIAAVKRIDTEL